MERIVIAGASVAGLSAAETLREEGFAGKIVLLGAEPHLPYDRPPLSKEFISGDSIDPATGRLLRDADFFREFDLDLRLGCPATGLDSAARQVLTAQGPIGYDALIIATGCRTRSVPVEGTEAALPVVRTLEDAQALRTAVPGARSAVLIGSGFIGLETAAALRTRGLEVTVIGNTVAPLEPRLGPEIADWVQRLHERHGTVIRNGVTVETVRHGPEGYSVALDDGSTVTADLALAGIGVIPNTEWLEGSGVACSNGVICDRDGATSVHGIWAAGDLASWPQPEGDCRRVEHWTSAADQGRHVALAILGRADEHYQSLPYAWSDQYDLKLQTFGCYRPGQRTLVVEGSLEGEDFLALHTDGDRLTGITVAGMSPRMRAFRRLLQRRAPLQEALDLAGLQAA